PRRGGRAPTRRTGEGSWPELLSAAPGEEELGPDRDAVALRQPDAEAVAAIGEEMGFGRDVVLAQRVAHLQRVDDGDHRIVLGMDEEGGRSRADDIHRRGVNPFVDLA